MKPRNIRQDAQETLTTLFVFYGPRFMQGFGFDQLLTAGQITISLLLARICRCIPDYPTGCSPSYPRNGWMVKVIVLVYHRILGDASQEPEDNQWPESKMALTSLSPQSTLDSKLSSTLNERFVESCKESGIPMGLLNYLDDQIRHYASFNPAQVCAISLTKKDREVI